MFSDFANLSGLLLVIIVALRLGKIPLWLAFFLGLFTFIPFILNDFIFPASYMPDQFGYLQNVQNLRDGNLEYIHWSNTVGLASMILALVPLPFVETIYSLGFFNRLIVIILIVWLYASKKLRGWPLLFFIFYPSFLLYSSLALRDTLVFLFMVIPVILFLENRRFVALLFALPLFILKFQNFFLIVIFFFLHLAFTKDSFFYKYRVVFLVASLVIFSQFLFQIIEAIEYYRVAMYYEDGGVSDDYVPIQSISEFLILGLRASPYFLLKPFPWESSSLLQLVQSFENILIFWFLAFLFWRTLKINKIIAIKWFIFLFSALTVYGLVVFNYGTAVRYKFPFILMVTVGMAYELFLEHGKFLTIRRN